MTLGCSAGKLAEDVLSSVLHATAPPAGGALASGSDAANLNPNTPSPGVARPVPRLLERAQRDPDFDDLRGKPSDAAANGGASTSAAGKRDATWMVRLSGMLARLPARLWTTCLLCRRSSHKKGCAGELWFRNCMSLHCGNEARGLVPQCNILSACSLHKDNGIVTVKLADHAKPSP